MTDRSSTDYKQAAIEQWTADPCGSNIAEGAPGSRDYFVGLIEGRHAYAPWMAESLGYAATEGLDVLDVGCGQGIDVARYAMEGARATGVDLTPRHVELAQAHLAAMGLKGRVVIGDAEALPFSDASFDRVSSNGVLHHTPDMPAALREINRVLRPGGQARVIVYNRNSLHYWLDQVLIKAILRGGLLRERSMEEVLTRVEVSSVDARPLVRVYSPRQLRQMMCEAGFQNVKTHVRHFQPEDSFVTGFLARRSPRLRARRTLELLGRIGGWYVVGSGLARR
jgi:ubiquinone/menaquinone biosynthesis C-methylase UbiE